MTKATETGKSLKLQLHGAVNDDVVAPIIRQLFDVGYRSDIERIQLWICSGGGTITVGLGLCDVIKASPVPVDTVAYGLCASMGMTILQAGVRRYAMANTRLMIHRCTTGDISNGVVSSARSCVDSVSELERQNHGFVAERVGMKRKRYMKFMGDRRDMSAQEALAYGFIDGIWEGAW